MNKKELLEIFNELLERFENAESYCIQDFYTSDDDYNHEDLESDIKEYKKRFREALNL